MQLYDIDRIPNALCGQLVRSIAFLIGIVSCMANIIAQRKGRKYFGQPDIKPLIRRIMILLNAFEGPQLGHALAH